MGFRIPQMAAANESRDITFSMLLVSKGHLRRVTHLWVAVQYLQALFLFLQLALHLLCINAIYGLSYPGEEKLFKVIFVLICAHFTNGLKRPQLSP